MPTWQEIVADKYYDYGSSLLAVLVSGKYRDGSPYSMPMVEGGGLAPLGYQQITGLSSAQALTVPANSVLAILKPEAQGVRWRDDGTNPTALVGMPLASGAEFIYNGNLSALRFIEEIAGAKLNVLYYGSPA